MISAVCQGWQTEEKERGGQGWALMKGDGGKGRRGNWEILRGNGEGGGGEREGGWGRL